MAWCSHNYRSLAGVRGTITRQLGTFVETTKKGNVKAHHWIYEMHINEIMKKWPEKKKRERRWVGLVCLLTIMNQSMSEYYDFSSLHLMKP